MMQDLNNKVIRCPDCRCGNIPSYVAHNTAPVRNNEPRMVLYFVCMDCSNSYKHVEQSDVVYDGSTKYVE
jgi:DNA-directed RNA polymerase subunit RPC12/RpoP